MTPLNNSIKAIFADIDGTLFSHSTCAVPPGTVSALESAHKQGLLLFIATGRHPAEIHHVQQLSQLPFSGTVSMDGQFATGKNGEVLRSVSIPQEDIAMALAFLKDYHHPALFSMRDNMYITQITDLVRHVCDTFHLPQSPIVDLDRVQTEDIFQLGLYTDADTVPAIAAQMGGCKWTRWHKYSIDIIPRQGGKWAGVVDVAARFGVKPEEIMTIGDGHNDVEMLQMAPVSVAMGNGCDAAKAVASHVADDIDNDGFAKALRDLLGI